MKKVFIGVLAALMLFAFTACEQQGYKIPTGLTVEATRTSYLEGEAIDFSTITGTVEYSDGSTKTVPGSALTANTNKANSAEPVLRLMYGGSSSGVAAAVNLTVYGNDDITALQVTAPTTAKASATSLTADAVATLPDGTTTNVKVTITVSVPSAIGEATLTATKVEVGTEDLTKDAKGLEDWKVTVVTGTDFDAEDISSIVVEQTEGEWVTENVSYKVYAVDGDGNKKELASSEYTWKDGKAPASSYQLKKTAQSDGNYVAIYNTDPTIESTAFNYSAGKSWIVNITVTPKESTSVPSGDISSTVSTYYDFKVQWAGGDTEAGTTWTYTEGTNAVLKNPTVPAYGTGEGQATSYTAQMALKYGKNDEWHNVTVNAMPIVDNG